MLEALDADAVRTWCRTGLLALGSSRSEIDALNVFPVPDGDTGTNLYLTVEAAEAAVRALPPDADLASTVTAMAAGALMGARGNSGIILSQLVRGVAATMSTPPAASVGPAVVAAALVQAADAAYAAVARPVEGTMLSVARAAARAAASARGALADVVRAAAEGAYDALGLTTGQLPALQRAGVVDAGGRGLSVLLDALVTVVTGAAPARRPAALPAHLLLDADSPAEERAFEVMYLLDAPEQAVKDLRARLAELGDSVVVVGGDLFWNVHVHVDDAGAAIEAGIDAGRPHRIRVNPLLRRAPAAGRSGRRVVSVAAGTGLSALFEASGAAVVLAPPDRPPVSGEILAEIRKDGAAEVIVLPRDSASLAAAEAAAVQARGEGVRVAVVPTIATVQVLAALAVHEPSRSFDDDVVAMTTAAGHSRHGAVTVAAHEALTMAGRCEAGDVLGLVDGEVVLIGHDVSDAARDVVTRMLGETSELVTLVTGDAAPAGLADAITSHVKLRRPDVDVVVYDGGQSRYPLLVGVE